MKYLQYFEGRKRNWDKFYNENKKVMKCNDNNLTKLPELLPETLLDLECYNNKLTKLPELPKSLKELYCQNNQLIELSELPNDLLSLICFRNELTELPKLPKGLKRLDCRNNKLKELKDLPESLLELHCCNNDLIKPITYNIYIKVNDSLNGKDFGLFYTDEQIELFSSYEYQYDFLIKEPENFLDLKPFGYDQKIKNDPDFEHLFNADEMYLL